MLSEQRIRDIAASLPDPLSDGTMLDRLEGIALTDVRAVVTLAIQPSLAPTFEGARGEFQALLEKETEGLQVVQVILTGAKEAAPTAKPAGDKIKLPDIRHIIAVASGKGGVGKSTTAVNMAAAMVTDGHKVGLLDADIYGPSVPRLLGLNNKERGKPEGAQGRIAPPEVNGLKAMSIGLLLDEAAPLIWRGPMVQSALTQLLRDVEWGALDYLIIDLPPGTGDAQLTLAQKVDLSGAVIVSTPQDLALIDARKAIGMFRKVGVPVLGIIENMSQFICPACGTASDIFSHGGAKREAEAAGVPFLGELPLDINVRTLADGGTPIVWAQPEGEVAKRYGSIAATVTDMLA